MAKSKQTKTMGQEVGQGPERGKAIDLAMSAIEKQFGRGSIMRLDEAPIMEVQTTEPVKWKIRGGLSWKDLRILIKETLKLSVLSFFVKPWSWFRKAEHPGEF